MTRSSAPLVVGHRGAAGYRPEHTLASFELAVRLGADYVDIDLVPTRDGVLVCRHDADLGHTTDVALRPEFSERKRTAQVGDDELTGWFVEDFTAAEIATLRAVERLPLVRQHNTLWDRRFAVPTFEQVLDRCAQLAAELRRPVGVYPELKHPARFRALGLPVEERLAEILHQRGLDGADAPVIVQCFDPAALQHLRALGLRTRLALLMRPEAGHAVRTAADLAAVAEIAEVLAPEKSLVVARADDGTQGRPTGLVEAAHAAGLLVHPFTFRAENTYLPLDLRVGSPADPGDFGRATEELLLHWRAGVDGVFTDQPDIAVDARDVFLAG